MPPLGPGYSLREFRDDNPGLDIMITELGHFALILALGVAIVQMVLPAWGAHVREPRLMAVGEPAALAQLTLITIAFLSLTHAYVTSDFSVENVWANSHSAKPLLYKISGVWGNHEGSMLLWVLILALFGATVALFGTHLPAGLRANVLSVQAVIAAAFLGFIECEFSNTLTTEKSEITCSIVSAVNEAPTNSNCASAVERATFINA